MATATADPTPTDTPPVADPPAPAAPAAPAPVAPAAPAPAPAPTPTPPATPPAAAAPSGATLATSDAIPPSNPLTAPEGSYFDEATLTLIAAEADALGVPRQTLANQRAAFITELRATGLAEVKADPELGGRHYDETVELVKAGRAWLAPKGSRAEQKLIQLFDVSGLGNDVDLVRMLTRIGRAVREEGGTHVTSRSPAREARTIAEILYDHTPTQ